MDNCYYSSQIFNPFLHEWRPEGVAPSASNTPISWTNSSACNLTPQSLCQHVYHCSRTPSTKINTILQTTFLLNELLEPLELDCFGGIIAEPGSWVLSAVNPCLGCSCVECLCYSDLVPLHSSSVQPSLPIGRTSQ
ncbi:hypothetical protein GOODEAATRI_011933 [Goodea atripinnis]|uniref:Uncharacterized protein n=1 Tax=Goodea atripinnis TaxID=208336 RepID=A0ABV0NTU5_9TELE